MKLENIKNCLLKGENLRSQWPLRSFNVMTSKSCGGNEEQSSLIKAATFTDFELIDLGGQNSLQSRSKLIYFLADLEGNNL